MRRLMRMGLVWGLCMLCAFSALSEAAQPEEAITGELAVEDFTFSGLVFPTATLEDCLALWGEPLTDDTEELYGIRKVRFQEGMYCEFVVRENIWQLAALRVTDGVLLGPRDLAIEDSTQSVVDRFGVSKDDDSFFYTCEDEEGNRFALSCSFSNDLLTGYLVYRL